MTIHHESIVNKPGGQVVVDWICSAREAVYHWLAAMAKHRRSRQTFKRLSAVDTRTLKDIGLDRSEIMSISYGDQTERRRLNYWI